MTYRMWLIAMCAQGLLAATRQDVAARAIQEADKIIEALDSGK